MGGFEPLFDTLTDLLPPRSEALEPFEPFAL